MADGTLALVERGEELSRASPQCREYYQASGYAAREEGIFLMLFCSKSYFLTNIAVIVTEVSIFPLEPSVPEKNFAQLLVVESRPR